jgi:hypothetical protein
MIFSCGDTPQTKYRKYQQKLRTEAEWHPWFCWYPVTISKEGEKKTCVWLQVIWRKYGHEKEKYSNHLCSNYTTEYRIKI